MPFAFSISVLRKDSAFNIHHRFIIDASQETATFIKPISQQTTLHLATFLRKRIKFTRPIRAISDTIIKFNQIITKET